MNKIKVSSVSYTNSKPFVFGLKQADDLENMDLCLDIPSACAVKLIEGQVDIGLVPVAALLQIPGYKIVSPYCIGADGAVDSVFIFSTKPIAEVKSVRLDSHSRTSNNLARVLLKNYWKLDVEFRTEGEADAFVLIGDRTFGKKNEFPYGYDLGEQWKLFTGLPFAFAVWAANKTIPEEFLTAFNRALSTGLNHRSEVIASLPKIEGFDYHDYLMHKVDFNLDEAKLEAISRFHQLIKDL